MNGSHAMPNQLLFALTCKYVLGSSIAIGFRFRSGSPHQTVTQMHFNHFDSLEAFFLICLHPFSLILKSKTDFEFLIWCISLFQLITIKFKRFFSPFYFCISSKLPFTTRTLTCILNSLKLSESEQVWNGTYWKMEEKSLIKENHILQCIGIDPQPSLKVFGTLYHNNCQRQSRNIRSILPN